MKHKYKKINMVDIDENEQIYLENILNITNYRGQNIKIVNNKIFFISDLKKPEDFSKSDDIYNVLLESYSYFFNKYRYNNIDKNILNDIKKSLKGIKKFSEDNFKIRPIFDYIEIEIINFSSSNNEIEKSKSKSKYENISTFRNDISYSPKNSSESYSDNEKLDDDFCIIDIDNNYDKNNEILHKRKNINTTINTTNTTKKDSISNNDKKIINTKKQIDETTTKTNNNCNNVNIDIKDDTSISDDENVEYYNISEKIQKFLSATTTEICNFCSNQNIQHEDDSKHIHNISGDDKKESFSYKFKNICNDIKKSLRSISFNDCFSGLTCICCSKIEEEENINNSNIR